MNESRYMELLYIDYLLEKNGVKHLTNQARIELVSRLKNQYDKELKEHCEVNPNYMFEYGWVDQFIMNSKENDPKMYPAPIYMVNHKHREGYINHLKSEYFDTIYQIDQNEPGYIQRFLWIDSYLKRINPLHAQHWYLITDELRRGIHQWFIKYQKDMRKYRVKKPKSLRDMMQLDIFIERKHRLPRFLVTHADRVKFNKYLEDSIKRFDYQYCLEKGIKISQLYDDYDDYKTDYDEKFYQFIPNQLMKSTGTYQDLVTLVSERYENLTFSEGMTRVSFTGVYQGQSS